MVIGAIDGTVAVCLPVALVAMRTIDIGPLDVVRVPAELRRDRSTAINRHCMATEAASLVSPLCRCIAMAGNVGALAGCRIVACVRPGNGRIEYNIYLSVQVQGIVLEFAGSGAARCGEMAVGADDGIRSATRMGIVTVGLGSTGATVAVIG